MKDVFMEWSKCQDVGDYQNKQNGTKDCNAENKDAENKDDDFFCSVNGRDKF